MLLRIVGITGGVTLGGGQLLFLFVPLLVVLLPTPALRTPHYTTRFPHIPVAARFALDVCRALLRCRVRIWVTLPRTGYLTCHLPIFCAVPVYRPVHTLITLITFCSAYVHVAVTIRLFYRVHGSPYWTIPGLRYISVLPCLPRWFSPFPVGYAVALRLLRAFFTRLTFTVRYVTRCVRGYHIRLVHCSHPALPRTFPLPAHFGDYFDYSFSVDYTPLLLIGFGWTFFLYTFYLYCCEHLL